MLCKSVICSKTEFIVPWSAFERKSNNMARQSPRAKFFLTELSQ